jgi:hypothetical protein
MPSPSELFLLTWYLSFDFQEFSRKSIVRHDAVLLEANLWYARGGALSWAVIGTSRVDTAAVLQRSTSYLSASEGLRLTSLHEERERAHRWPPPKIVLISIRRVEIRDVSVFGQFIIDCPNFNNNTSIGNSKNLGR